MQQAIILDQLCHLQPDWATFIVFFADFLHLDTILSAFIFLVFQADAGMLP